MAPRPRNNNEDSIEVSTSRVTSQTAGASTPDELGNDNGIDQGAGSSSSTDPVAARAVPTTMGPTVTFDPISLTGIDINSSPKLDGKDSYKTWNRFWSSMIDVMGGFDIMETYPTEDTVPLDSRKAWKDKQRRCVKILLTTLGDSAERLLEGQTTVVDFFAKAKGEYLDEGIGGLQRIQQEWDNLRLRDFDSVRALGRKISSLQEEYTAIGPEHKLPESQLILRLLQALDQEQYSDWKINLCATHNKKLPTFQDALRSAEEEARAQEALPS